MGRMPFPGRAKPVSSICPLARVHQKSKVPIRMDLFGHKSQQPKKNRPYIFISPMDLCQFFCGIIEQIHFGQKTVANFASRFTFNKTIQCFLLGQIFVHSFPTKTFPNGHSSKLYRRFSLNRPHLRNVELQGPSGNESPFPKQKLSGSSR